MLKWLERAAWVGAFAALLVASAMSLGSHLATARFEELHAGGIPPVDRPTGAFAWATPDKSEWSESRVAAFVAAKAGEIVPQASGVLRIPGLELEAPVFDGTSERYLDLGIGRIEGTAHFTESGNIALAGHRDGHFRRLKEIAIGDRIELRTVAGLRSYEVRDLQVVNPEDVHVLAPTRKETLTLVTCYPFYFMGHAPQRFIVRAEEVGPADPEPERA